MYASKIRFLIDRFHSKCGVTSGRCYPRTEVGCAGVATFCVARQVSVETSLRLKVLTAVLLNSTTVYYTAFGLRAQMLCLTRTKQSSLRWFGIGT